MPNPRSRNRLLLSLVALVGAFVIAPAASAAALSTEVEVGMTAGSISPATVTGSAGDTFQIRNAGSESGGWIGVLDGSGSVSVSQSSCAPSRGCWFRDGNTVTVTIISPGTLKIDRDSSFSGMSTIGTLTISAPAEPVVVPTPVIVSTPAATPLTCDSSKWNFGILDISKSGFGDRLQVTWTTPNTCDGSSISSYELMQSTTKDGATTAADLSKCSPPGANSTGWGKEASGAGVLHACSFPVNGPDERWFRLTAETSQGKTIQSRRIAWIRSDVPNADVQDFSGLNCNLGHRGMRPVNTVTLISGTTVNFNSAVVCLLVRLVIQTKFVTNGDQALTDKQMFELLSIGVSFADSETARSGRATRWISAGQRSYRVRRSGPAAIQVPLNANASARLRVGSLRIRYTINIKRGSVTKQIVKYATLPKVAATGVPSSVTG